MPRDENELFHIAVSLAACLIAAGLYRIFGFMGVGVLGLFILSAASRLELEDGRGVGGGNEASIYARQVQAEQRFSHAEQAAWRSERGKSRKAVRYAQMVGLAFLVVGGTGFALLDLHMWR